MIAIESHALSRMKRAMAQSRAPRMVIPLFFSCIAGKTGPDPPAFIPTLVAMCLPLLA